MSQEDEKKPVEILESLQVGRIKFPPGLQPKPGGRMLEPWMHGQGALHEHIRQLEKRLKMLEELLKVEAHVEHINCNYLATRGHVCNKCGQLVSEDKVTRVVSYALEHSDERSHS